MPAPDEEYVEHNFPLQREAVERRAHGGMIDALSPSIEAVRYRILGPLEVRRCDDWVGIGAPKWRTLLAALLCDANSILSADYLKFRLWGDTPPRSGSKLLQVYIHQVRRFIGDPNGERLYTHAPGYKLVVRSGETDIDLFSELAQQGDQALSEGRFDVAAQRFRVAISIWRGPVYADLDDCIELQSERELWEFRRTAVLEALVEAELARGRSNNILIAELRALISRYRLHERFYEQLMLAYSRDGRRADALATYCRLQRVLHVELGVQPSATTRHLARQIAIDNQSLRSA